MSKVLICFILTCVFSFLGLQSFMTKDYGPLKEWLTYYQEYKALQGALNKGNTSKDELLARLKKMYPERAQELENKFKEKYGDVKDSAADTQDTIESKFSDTVSSSRTEPAHTGSSRQETRSSQPQASSSSRSSSSRATDKNADTVQNNKSSR